MGRKAKAGFYAYDDAGKRTGLWDGLDARFPRADDQPDLTDVQHRLMLAQMLEAVRALEDGVLEDIREGDVGAILGWGFAPWTGGPFGWLDMLGAERAVAIADDLTARHGDRFAAPGPAARDGRQGPDLLRPLRQTGRKRRRLTPQGARASLRASLHHANIHGGAGAVSPRKPRRVRPALRWQTAPSRPPRAARRHGR